MLLDTGAKLSCVNASFLDALETINATTYKSEPSAVELVGANNAKLNNSKVVFLPISFRHATVSWPFHVVQNLSPLLLAGMDLLHHVGANINTASNTVTFSAKPAASASRICLVTQHDICIDPASTTTVKVRVADPDDNTSLPNTTGITDSVYSNVLPGIIETDGNGLTTVAALNDTVTPKKIPKGSILATFSPITSPESSWLTEDTIIKAISPVQAPVDAPATPQLSQQQLQQRRRDLLPKLQVNCPPQYAAAYTTLLLEFADVFSLSDNDLGFSTQYEHRIDLTTSNPVHVKQFRIPLTQQKFVDDRVRELAKLKCIEPSTSPYNTPIFAVPKKTLPGEAPRYRLIQDLRKINEVTQVDKHSICDVRACLDKIGQLQATVFSSIDLRAGYYQMGLAKDSRPFTAFTLPNLGQWQWRVTTMGLTGAPASFCKLMEKVMTGMPFILRYLDDLLAASKDHATHLQHLRLALARLRQHNLKINPEKSSFGANSVEYLGHTVSSAGFTIGEHKFAAIRDFPQPNTKRRVQQFLGLASYFRQLIPNFQRNAGHLSALTTTDNAWKSGPLPPRAALAFSTLRNALLTKPIVSFPQPDKEFTLATDAAVGDANNPGGLGAVLTQTIDGHDRVIAYASRALKQHEKKQSAFQLELQAVIWALNHFGPYLRHATFTVVTDCRPLANLSQQQLKSLHRLHEKMLEFPCIIKYRPGILNDIADALSRNPPGANITAINDDEALHDLPNLLSLQDQDSFCAKVMRIMDNDQTTIQQEPALAALKDKFTRYNGLLALHDATGVFDGRRIIVPRTGRMAVLRAAHDHPLAGHRGVDKTTQNITCRFWWPGMTSNISQYVKNCASCQKSKNPKNFSSNMPLAPLPTPTEPNVRIHADLFGPLPKSPTGNKWILTMTCAFSKFVRVVPLPNKEAQTVATAILTHWISVFGPMKRLVTDQGREFNCKLLQDLLTGLGIEPRTTSAMAPSVNGEAEIFNKWIASYIKTMTTNPAAEWEGHLAALNLAYNTTVHAAHKFQPAKVMFGRRFSMPHIDPTDAPAAKLSWAQQQQQILRKTWGDTQRQLNAASDNMMQQQRSTRIFIPMQGERVLLFYPRTALAAKGTPKLQQQWQEAVVLAQLGPATFLVRPRWSKLGPSMVHANRLKPFLPRLVLAPAQWCTDPAKRPRRSRAAAAADHQQSQAASIRSSRAAAELTDKLPCPASCPCKKKKRKRGVFPPIPSQTPAWLSFFNQQQQQQDLFLPRPRAQTPYWLRPSPRRTPQTPPTPATLLRQDLRRLQASPYAPSSDSSFHSAHDSTPEATPEQPGPSTRSRGISRFPQPIKKNLAPAILRRLSTKLRKFSNVVPSSSSSSSNSNSPAADSGSSSSTEQENLPLPRRRHPEPEQLQFTSSSNDSESTTPTFTPAATAPPSPTAARPHHEEPQQE